MGFFGVYVSEYFRYGTQHIVHKGKRMTGLLVILYAVLLTAIGTALLYLAYLGAAKVVDWREEND